MLWIAEFWKRNQFKIIVGTSIIILGYLYIYHRNGNGTYSTTFEYIPHRFHEHTSTTNKKSPSPMQFVKRTAKLPNESNGERECRRVLESLFGKEFPKIRPSFLRNEVTGRNLELDCSNESLKLAVEYQGRQHSVYDAYVHKNKEAFWNQQYRDQIKQRLCKENGWTVIEVPHTVPNEQIEMFLRSELRKHGYQF
jgi:hypothetical protein